jgi:hypothetical protein
MALSADTDTGSCIDAGPAVEWPDGRLDLYLNDELVDVRLQSLQGTPASGTPLAG